LGFLLKEQLSVFISKSTPELSVAQVKENVLISKKKCKIFCKDLEIRKKILIKKNRKI